MPERPKNDSWSAVETETKRGDKPSSGEHATALSAEAAVAIAALLNLLRLTGAELVLSYLASDSDRFEKAVRAKIDQFTPPPTTPAARDAGLSLARHLVEQVLAQIRAQAEVKRRLTPDASSRTKTEAETRGKLLN